MPCPRAGIIAAIWTPTDGHGQVLGEALQTNLDFLRARGIHGLMVLGSTGEFLHLEPPARQAFLRRVKAGAGPLPLIANVTHIAPAVVAALAGDAAAAGADAIALLPPPFYRIAQSDLAEFLLRAADAAQLPLLIYNFPERCGNRVNPETIATVADRTPVFAVKQSGDEFGYHRELAALAREKDFSLFSGADTRLAEVLALGAHGLIGGCVNFVPELLLEILAAVQAGHPDTAARASQRMHQLGQFLDTLEFPLNIAAAMEARGLPVGEPKGTVSAATRARYGRLRTDLSTLFREWQLN